jgi:pantoate--beta-alanine ligase
VRLVAAAREMLASEPLAKPDYVEVVDGDSFDAIARVRGKCLMVLAARFGATRLIDNLLIEVDEGPARCEL